jgi:hypothetical protein
MDKEGKILDLIMKMIEQSTRRMERLLQRNEEGYSELDGHDISLIRLEQKEFEMQMKLLDKVVKNWKAGKGLVELTPDALQKKEGE